MKYFYMKSLSLAFMLFLSVVCFSQNKVTTLHLFGVAYNFADSTAYFTTLQSLEKETIEEIKGFINVYPYTQQLQNFLTNQNNQKQIVVSVFASEESQKMEKKILKLRSFYKKKHKYKEVGKEKFVFQSIK